MQMIMPENTLPQWHKNWDLLYSFYAWEMGELGFECRVVRKYSKAKMIEKIGDIENSEILWIWNDIAFKYFIISENFTL